MSENNNVTLDPGEAVISAEVIRTIQQAVTVLVQSAAQINNVVRNIDRNYGGADDPLIVSAMASLANTAGDLSYIWGELELSLASHDLLR